MVSRQREWQKTHPEQNRAQQAVHIAVKTGKLIPQPCEFCGATENVDAHHEDYSAPLDVTWLCHLCHLEYHAEKRAKEEAEAKALLPPSLVPTGEPRKFECLRCGHVWWSFLERPVACPRCKHYHWDTSPREPKKIRQSRRQPVKEENNGLRSG